MNTVTNANFDIDHSALENIMRQEETQPKDDLFGHILSPARTIAKADYFSHGRNEPVPGTLTSRIFSLLEETHGCIIQTDFRDKVVDHPALELVRDELVAASVQGDLNHKFDLIEATGAIVVYDRSKFLVTIGLNRVTMRSKIRENLHMVDLRNARIIDRLNGVPDASFDFEPKKNKRAEPSQPEMSTTFYVSFKLQ
ncbi:hypothetical protein D3C78_308540 [compost metagenome]